MGPIKVDTYKLTCCVYFTIFVLCIGIQDYIAAARQKRAIVTRQQTSKRAKVVSDLDEQLMVS